MLLPETLLPPFILMKAGPRLGTMAMQRPETLSAERLGWDASRKAPHSSTSEEESKEEESKEEEGNRMLNIEIRRLLHHTPNWFVPTPTNKLCK